MMLEVVKELSKRTSANTDILFFCLFTYLLLTGSGKGRRSDVHEC